MHTHIDLAVPHTGTQHHRLGDQEACELAAAERRLHALDIQGLTGYPVAIRPVPYGQGLFATRHIEPGETVLSADIHQRVPQRTATSFEIAPGGVHAELSFPAARINHSCRPNTGIRDNAAGGYDFIVGPDGIPEGGEILTHYGMHEWASVAIQPGQCECGAPECEGRALGWGELDDRTRTRLAEGYGVARHLTHPTTVRGVSIGIQLEGTIPPSHSSAIARFIEALCKEMEVQPFFNPQIQRYGNGHLFGWTWMQMISASSLTGHHYEATGQVWLDLVSCRPHHAETIAQFAARYWQAAAYTFTENWRS